MPPHIQSKQAKDIQNGKLQSSVYGPLYRHRSTRPQGKKQTVLLNCQQVHVSQNVTNNDTCIRRKEYNIIMRQISTFQTLQVKTKWHHMPEFCKDQTIEIFTPSGSRFAKMRLQKVSLIRTHSNQNGKKSENYNKKIGDWDMW